MENAVSYLYKTESPKVLAAVWPWNDMRERLGQAFRQSTKPLLGPAPGDGAHRPPRHNPASPDHREAPLNLDEREAQRNHPALYDFGGSDARGAFGEKPGKNYRAAET